MARSEPETLNAPAPELAAVVVAAAAAELVAEAAVVEALQTRKQVS